MYLLVHSHTYHVTACENVSLSMQCVVRNGLIVVVVDGHRGVVQNCDVHLEGSHL